MAIPIINYGPRINGADADKWHGCTVCLEDPNQQDLMGHNAAAGSIHAFHRECLEQWTARNSTCPECRTPFQRDVEPLLEGFELNSLLIPAGVMLLLTASALEPVCPRIKDVSEKHLRFSAQHIKSELSVAAAASIILLVSGNLPLLAKEVLDGAVFGYGISSFVRLGNGEDQNRNPDATFEEQAGALLRSRSFQVSVLTTASAALLTGGVALAATSLGMFAAGAIANYGVEKLHEHNYVSQETKETAQRTVTAASAVASFISPMKAIGSAVTGAVVGAAVRSVGTVSEGIQNIWNWARS